MRSGLPALAAALLLLPGCYRYVPVEAAAVPQGQDVRVQVARRVLLDLPDGVRAQGDHLTGSLVARAGDSLTIRVPVAARTEGIHRVALSQDVVVGRDEILGVQRRELARGSTAAVTLGAVGVGVALVALIIEASSPGTPRDGEGPDQILVPLLSVPVP